MCNILLLAGCSFMLVFAISKAIKNVLKASNKDNRNSKLKIT